MGPMWKNETPRAVEDAASLLKKTSIKEEDAAGTGLEKDLLTLVQEIRVEAKARRDVIDNDLGLSVDSMLRMREEAIIMQLLDIIAKSESARREAQPAPPVVKKVRVEDSLYQMYWQMNATGRCQSGQDVLGIIQQWRGEGVFDC